MAARLSGRPTPRRKSPGSEDDTQVTEVQSKPSRQNILLFTALTVSLLLAGISTAGILYLTLNPQAGLNESHEPSASDYQMGPMIELGQFTVNLGDVNQRRFLRVSLTLAFSTSDPKFIKGNSQKKEAWIEAFKTEIKEKLPVFQDIVVTTLSAKTAESLGTLQGKTELKAELVTRFNQYLEKSTHVQDVYLTEFIIQ